MIVVRKYPRLVAAALVGVVTSLTLTVASAQVAGAPPGSQRFGQPAVDAAAERVVRIGTDARWINVKQNETVRIERDGRSFTWQFSTWTDQSFDLATIAPAGFASTSGVRVFVTPDPRDRGN
jgi:hypothetical protein